MLQFVASLTDNTRSVNYDCNTFKIQATEFVKKEKKKFLEKKILVKFCCNKKTNYERKNSFPGQCYTTFLGLLYKFFR